MGNVHRSTGRGAKVVLILGCDNNKEESMIIIGDVVKLKPASFSAQLLF